MTRMLIVAIGKWGCVKTCGAFVQIVPWPEKCISQHYLIDVKKTGLNKENCNKHIIL